jgi:hypothetical protein
MQSLVKLPDSDMLNCLALISVPLCNRKPVLQTSRLVFLTGYPFIYHFLHIRFLHIVIFRLYLTKSSAAIKLGDETDETEGCLYHTKQ